MLVRRPSSFSSLNMRQTWLRMSLIKCIKAVIATFCILIVMSYGAVKSTVSTLLCSLVIAGFIGAVNNFQFQKPACFSLVTVLRPPDTVHQALAALTHSDCLQPFQ